MGGEKLYDIAIAGGGLAGLSLAILLARKDYSVILLEKEKYPFHKVCGEYISMESHAFLHSLVPELERMDLPRIQRLHISDCSGRLLKQALQPGGFGISRYSLDHLLAQKAREAGVDIREDCRVETIEPGELFRLKSGSQQFHAKLAAGSWGKRSQPDIRLKRPFVENRSSYVAVKYHIRYPADRDLISLHNFANGYCGISMVEEGKACLCYLARSEDVKKAGSIKALEEQVIYRNPHLREIFERAEFLYDKPLSIAQVSFSRKEQVKDGIFMLGDAAGLITPLCGNGMSMALRSAKILAEEIETWKSSVQPLSTLEQNYTRRWKKEFSPRLSTGRTIQRFFGNPVLTRIFLSSLRPFPFIRKGLVGLTHGKTF